MELGHRFSKRNQVSLISRCRHKCFPVRCCDRRREGRSRTKKNYYELLGVSVDSSTQKIKEAYRKLQKKYHPDIAGHKVRSMSHY
jgi:DnaJ-domain-containing protein 1